jgi:hypothetical protein
LNIEYKLSLGVIAVTVIAYSIFAFNSSNAEAQQDFWTLHSCGAFGTLGVCERLDILIEQNERIIDLLNGTEPTIVEEKTGYELIKNHGADRCEFFDHLTNERFYASCTWWDGYFD